MALVLIHCCIKDPNLGLFRKGITHFVFLAIIKVLEPSFAAIKIEHANLLLKK